MVVGHQEGTLFVVDATREANVDLQPTAKSLAHELSVTLNKDSATNPVCRIQHRGQVGRCEAKEHSQCLISPRDPPRRNL